MCLRTNCAMSSEMEVSEQNNQRPACWRSVRHLIAFVACLGYLNLFAQRVNVSLALVCMVNHTAVTLRQQLKQQDLQTKSPINDSYFYQSSGQDNSPNASWVATSPIAFSHGCNVNGSRLESCGTLTSSDGYNEDGDLIWDKKMQGIVLSAYYWGHAMLQIPAQGFIKRFGPKKVSLTGMFLMSTMSLLGPTAAEGGPWLFIVSRFVLGLGTAVVLTSMYAIWGNWAPNNEKTILISIFVSGGYLANTLVFPTSGWLCRHGFAGGWPSVFYVYALSGFLWCGVWFVVFYDSPETHPWIGLAERKYITANSDQDYNYSTGKQGIPWTKILTSRPVWATVAAQIGFNWTQLLFLSYLPQYMREILKVDIQSNGVFAMLPQLALFISIISWGAFVTFLMQRNLLTTIAVRKLSTVLGDCVPAALFIAVSFLNRSNQAAIIAMLTCAIGASGLNYQGSFCNSYDIGSQFAAPIFSFANTMSVITGIISPYIVSALTIDETREQWQIVFFVTAGISAFCVLFFLVFGSAEEMHWVKAYRTATETDRFEQETSRLSDRHVENMPV